VIPTSRGLLLILYSSVLVELVGLTNEEEVDILGDLNLGAEAMGVLSCETFLF